MSQYMALYRKWRPSVFADVVGQDHITKVLIAYLVFAQKNKVMPGRILFSFFEMSCPCSNIGLATDYRLYAFGFRFLIKIDSAVHNTVVGDGYGVLTKLCFFDGLFCKEIYFVVDTGCCLELSELAVAFEFMAEGFALGYMREKGMKIPEKYGNDSTYSSMVLNIVKKYFGK